MPNKGSHERNVLNLCARHYMFLLSERIADQDGQQGRYDPRGEGGQGARGVLNWTSQGPHRLGKEQHPGSHQL